MIMSETEKPRGPCRPGDPDEESVARMLDGHDAATALDKKYRAGLLAHAAEALRDRDRAERVVQETFADAFTELRTFKGQSSFFTWLYGFFKNRLLRERSVAAVAARREVDFESESATRSGDAEDQGAAQPQESGWIDQIEQALTLGRQHTPEKDHEVRGRLLEVVKDIREVLPPQTKEVFYLIVAGLSFGEIARVLGTSEANVRNHVRRGRAALKEKRDGRMT
jgi:RNA polymerase sigma factor (sigma-70 family)